jgi:predicted O-methyltransferase YrrM
MAQSPIRRALSSKVRYDVERALWRWRNQGWHSPDRTSFNKDARPGEVAELFAQITNIGGWFTYDDAAAFLLTLRLQTALGLRGDVLEIGSYQGRSTCVLARGLAPGEKLVVCDPMQAAQGYEAKPTSEMLQANVARTNPGFDLARLTIHPVFSSSLVLPPDQRFRFVHVDGSHDYEDALADLRLAYRHLDVGGVIAVDDYEHPQWPGVTPAVEKFLAEHDEVAAVADLNRHAESGRKLYLARRSAGAQALPA